jgi:dihydroorotate dehydrogenase electron transfer subunit
MDKFKERTTVVSQKEIAAGIYDLTLQTKEIAAAARAGQFVSVYCNDASRLLPRPISLCGFDSAKGTIRLVYRAAGKGTKELSALKTGDTVEVLGPLGNGFTVLPGKSALLIGGGIGVPPMLQLAKDITDGTVMGLDAADSAAIPQIQIVMGYRDAQTFLLDEFKEAGETSVATENGSVGTKGNVLDAIREKEIRADVIYACGPKPMLRALAEYAAQNHMECFVSMEERMACGIGACLACVCKTKETDGHSHVHNTRICKEGPVFDAREVDLS